MSKQQHILQIEPPKYGRVTEEHEFYGFVCPVCNGEGGHIDYDHLDKETGRIENRKIPCNHCDGTGKLSVTIESKWKPFYE
ncbi:MAG: hypothetical protein LUE98_07630 [Tannerellaceae bacterium]|nr:hypothetical protein [Tannerellaceae bacterium]